MILDPWYGKVKNTVMQTRVVFPDGARCIVSEDDLYDLDFVPTEDNSDELAYEHEIFPGTILTGERGNLSDVTWIQETKKHHKKMSQSQKIHVRAEEVRHKVW